MRIFSASQSEDINGAKGKQQLQKKSFDKSKKNRKSARKLEKKVDVLRGEPYVLNVKGEVTSPQNARWLTI